MPSIIGTKGTRVAEAPTVAVKPWLWPTVTVGVALIVLVASALTYVMVGYHLIYPNVFVDGVPVGGMNVDSANQILMNHVQSQTENAVIDVTADDITEKFTLEDAKVVYDVGAMSAAAFYVGREGSIIERLKNLSQAYFGRVDVPWAPTISMDTAYIQSRVSEMARQIDMPLREYETVIATDDIRIHNAQAGRTLDQASLVSEISRRFQDMEFTALTVNSVENLPQPIDIDGLYAQVFLEPKNAWLDTTDPAKAMIMPHQVGISFDREALATLLQSSDAEWFRIPLIKSVPEVTQTILQDNLFKDELASFTTYLSASNVPRTSNIRTSAGYMNDIVLAPGNEFSFNQMVGQRTKARGFQEAGAYVNGRLVPEFGGGVCQMSTTTYNAALLANLQITERNNHSMTVGYVPLGLDAMVNWGTSDLRFVNNTKFPIRILAEQKTNYVKVTILGTKENDNKVVMDRTLISTKPQQFIQKVNTAMAPGTARVVIDGHNGHVVDTFRSIVSPDGTNLGRTFEAKSTYRKVDQVTEVGPSATTTPVHPTTPTTSPVTPTTPIPTPAPATTPDPATPAPEPTPDPDVPEVVVD